MFAASLSPDCHHPWLRPLAAIGWCGMRVMMSDGTGGLHLAALRHRQAYVGEE
jgi:hypothetical protein